MGDVVVRAKEPALAAIKLAWWRDRLEELDAGKVPAEPRLEAAANQLLTRSIAGASLAALEDGWATLLEAEPDVERIADRGARLFAMAASLLGEADTQIELAGRLYAMNNVRRRGLISTRPPLGELAGHSFPRALRPLTALAALAARDSKRDKLEPEATPGRAFALLRHRLTGRIR